MNNKKGFTLVELLAVIAILAILAGVATPIVINARKKIKIKMYNAKVKAIKESAILCARSKSKTDCDTVSELCTAGFLPKDKECSSGTTTCSCQKNPSNDLSMDNCVIDLTNNTTTHRWVATFPNSTNPECNQ